MARPLRILLAGGWHLVTSRGNRPQALFLHDDDPQERAQMLERLADATRRLHDRHFVHHDYFWRNILLSHARTGANRPG
jgi:aminoglycoside/choline kinase family phosphotransferase